VRGAGQGTILSPCFVEAHEALNLALAPPPGALCLRWATHADHERLVQLPAPSTVEAAIFRQLLLDNMKEKKDDNARVGEPELTVKQNASSTVISVSVHFPCAWPFVVLRVGDSDSLPFEVCTGRLQPASPTIDGTVVTKHGVTMCTSPPHVWLNV